MGRYLGEEMLDTEDHVDWTGIALGVAIVVLGFAGFLVIAFGQPAAEERATQQGYQDAVLKRAYDRGYKEGMQK